MGSYIFRRVRKCQNMSFAVFQNILCHCAAKRVQGSGWSFKFLLLKHLFSSVFCQYTVSGNTISFTCISLMFLGELPPILSWRDGAVRGMSVMIKWCGAIWCEIWREFELVLSISLQKVDSILSEAQLYFVSIFDLTKPQQIQLVIEHIRVWKSTCRKQVNVCMKGVGIQRHSVIVGHNRKTWGCGTSPTVYRF